jgi:hypothetical protein
MSIFLATHSKPNLEIWQSLLFFFLTFGASKPPIALDLLILNYEFLVSNRICSKKYINGAGSLAGNSDRTAFLLCTVSRDPGVNVCEQ